MKLIGELKDKVDRAETIEEKKNILAEAGVEFTDEEMEDVVGGVFYSDIATKVCPKCSRVLRYDRNYCSCGHSFDFKPSGTKICPNCNRELHYSRSYCSCGYRLDPMPI